MTKIISQLQQLGSYETVRRCLDNKENVQITGCVDSGQVHFINEVSDGYDKKVIVTFDAKKAETIYQDIKGLGKEALIYPAKDFIFYAADAKSNQITRERQRAITKIIDGESFTVILTFDALMDKINEKNIIEENCFEIKAGDRLDLSMLKRRLISMGYTMASQVEESGQFSVRGSIVDIFTLTSNFPYRIDMWDDEVDIIKTFDVGSQRALEKLDSIFIQPACEYIISAEDARTGIEKIKGELEECEKTLRKQFKTEEANRIKVITNEFISLAEINIGAVQIDSYCNFFYERLVSIADYFDDDTLFIIDEPEHIKQMADGINLEFKESMINRLSGGYVLPGQTEVIWTYHEVLTKIKKYPKLIFTMLEQKISDYDVDEKVNVNMSNVSPYNNRFEVLLSDLSKYHSCKYTIILLSPSQTRGKRLTENIKDNNLFAVYMDSINREIKQGEIVVSVGNVHKGFVYNDLKLMVISESDIFGAGNKKKKKKKKYQGSAISNFSDLHPGDYVVHENHGVGIFKGIEKVEVDYVIKDYLKLQYGDGGFLYVATTQLNMIQKYSSSDAKAPKLNSLGGTEWVKTRTRVRKAVAEIAGELVELYAARQQNNGFEFSADTVWQKEFEEMFPYEETEDQLSAIAAVKSDMESSRIMDRLICGDVGFGKTEVAIRAAFKAVQDGKQVAYLVPTTVLAQQHYNTFTRRFKDFAVRVDLLSRFRTTSQISNTLKDLKRGSVDIVIGTHRLLSKDVNYNDLGLLIIDEEQRFGVRHKEKIKQLKENIDVISLTATPIPRTLHMSLIGVRDMSIMEDAPSERMPIQTYVMEHNDEVIREAIKRELNRQGQVYYIYNNVATIADVAASVSNLVPDARVAFAHGQMSERMIESIMYDFVNGDIDVLVSTTIVETGIDISNVNTIIIHDADKLGLSQLYQLRGRVGRSNKKAYAFMLYRRNKVLKEVAEKRLAAIRDFSELGAGFKIAMRDLEIRGAGNLLGAKQSGHLEAVGYDMYCKMLSEAVALKKGTVKEEQYETMIDLDVDAYIPSEYIEDEMQKLDIYKRISTVADVSEYEDMQDELIDRFGDIPFQVENLLKVALLRCCANKVHIAELSGGKSKFKIIIRADAPIDNEKLAEYVKNYRGRLKIKPVANPIFTYTIDKPLRGFDEIYENAMRLIDEIGGLRTVFSD